MLPRTTEQNEKIKDERREQILFNALKIFARRGLVATKISDIARVSGFSQGLIYHYFNSKVDIYEELVARAIDNSSEMLLNLEQLPLPPLEKITFIAETIVDIIINQEDAAYYFLLITQAAVTENSSDSMAAMADDSFAPFQVMLRIITEGQQQGIISQDSPQDLTIIFWATINGLALNKVIEGNQFPHIDSKIIARIFQTKN